MTLTTHALVGAAAASIFPEQPILAFIGGFISHLVIDSLPHWDYDGYLSSMQKNPANPMGTDMNMGSDAFIHDFTLIAGDAILGVVISIFLFHFWLFQIPLFIVIIGACAGILPDPLQFVYWKTRTRILKPLQIFHVWIQTGRKLKVAPWIGIGLQCLLVIVVIGVLKFVR